tara:strand:+ start:47 stop:283 length:237 start_codon:yes stop_codon:yes gene_type:complete
MMHLLFKHFLNFECHLNVDFKNFDILARGGKDISKTVRPICTKFWGKVNDTITHKMSWAFTITLRKKKVIDTFVHYFY